MEAVSRPNRTGNPFGAGVRRTSSWQTAAQQQNGSSADDDNSGDEVAQLVALSKKALEVQEESANATARMLATAKMTESLGNENLTKLHMQGEQLDSIHTRTEESSHKIEVAQARTSYLDKLSDSFLKPVFGREKVVKEKKSNVNFEWKAPAGTNGQPLWGRRVSSLPEEFPGAVPGAGAAAAEPGSLRNSKVQPGGVLGEWASSDDRQKSEMHEATIENNLNQISGVVAGIRHQAQVMGTELDRQTHVIRSTQDNVSDQTDKLRGVNQRIDKILRK
ncbi:hypothetical protein DFS34DRAFT_252900 [Phlyctochytrium arcticum]|nr:hypothetical protein DFS34DRAFT_252900 [Phlyctochytrium arcticum]